MTKNKKNQDTIVTRAINFHRKLFEITDILR